MRITGYLVAAVLGIGGGWLLFSPTKETPTPTSTPPVQASPPERPWTPPPTQAPSWQEQAVSRYVPVAPNPMEKFRYRPLSEREQQRLKARAPYPEEQFGYPAASNPPYWVKPGYDYRQTDRR